MSVFPERFESDRLCYERVHPESLDPLELYNHVSEDAPAIDEITEYVPWEPHSHPQETVEFVDDCGRAFDDGEYLTCSIRPKDGDDAEEIAGLASLGVEWDTLSAEIGIWLRKPFWGRGYSGERAARFLKLAFSHLDLEVVKTSHFPGNAKSKRAVNQYVKRFRGEKEGRIRNAVVIDGKPHDTVQYSITREEWEESQKATTHQSQLAD